MFSNCYQYCLILWCGVSAFVEISAVFAEAGCEILMEVETHNLEVFLKNLSGNAILYTWTRNAYAMATPLNSLVKNIFVYVHIFDLLPYTILMLYNKCHKFSCLSCYVLITSRYECLVPSVRNVFHSEILW
jgi:hypothetical protein